MIDVQRQGKNPQDPCFIRIHQLRMPSSLFSAEGLKLCSATPAKRKATPDLKGHTSPFTGGYIHTRRGENDSRNGAREV